MKTQFISLMLLLFAGCSKGSGNSDQPAPNITFDDVQLMEGTGSNGNAEVKLVLSRAASKEIVVTYSTVDGTAKGGEDFTAASNQTLTIKPGETGISILIPVMGDDIKEGDEQFGVRVLSATNANLLKGTSTITIQNDDTKVDFTDAGYNAPDSYAGYTLAWSDEFNGNSLNQADWTYEMGDGCPGLCGWGNNELQYYTNSAGNVFFQEGKMIIEAKKESVSGKAYTSARIKTEGKKAFQFGRIDIRAKLPRGKGIWPALWMLPQNNAFGGWPRSGELDIMELVGHEPNKVYGTVHFGPGPGSTQISRSYTLPQGAFNDEFHVFSIEWKKDEIRWYVDGNLFSTAAKNDFGSNTYPFNESFFFLINLAVGGNWPGNPDDATSFPQWLIVDYIRVYQ